MQWKILPKQSEDIIEQLLLNRGVKGSKQIEEFLRPQLKNYEPDLNITGIEKAKQRILQAIKNQELIFIYGDYDVDGVCGAAVLYLGLTKAGAKVLPYIPHREKEGYGISEVGLDFAKEKGVKVVISVDCGIVNFDANEWAKDREMDLIITDHHQPLGDLLPKCFGLVHSTKMCGTAVAWCLIRQLVSQDISEKLLDYVAIATVADMMPMLGVNRALVKEGLVKLNALSVSDTERVGLLTLINNSGLKLGHINGHEIGHVIAPQLNALGRVDHAMDAVRLLCTKDISNALKFANLVAEANNKRRILTSDAVAQAKLKINGSSKKIYVLSSETWASGIVGLVAGRVCEETGVPAVAISIGEQFSRGSARSVDGVNIVELIRKCSDILVAVGGHPGAAGFTISTEKISEFEQRLEILMDENVFIKNEEIMLEMDAIVKLNQLSIDLAKRVQKLDPFGIGNPKPTFATYAAKLTGIRVVGEGGKHLKGKVGEVDFIAFGMGELASSIKDGTIVNLAYALEIDRYNGWEKPQLNVKDIELTS